MSHNKNKVIWHEGLFLKPQHFQIQDEYFETLIYQLCSVIQTNFYGFSQLEIDEEKLKIGKISIKNATGIFPEGTYFNFPAADLIPVDLEISEDMYEQEIFLALGYHGEINIGGEDPQDLNTIRKYQEQVIVVRDRFPMKKDQTVNEVEINIAKIKTMLTPTKLNNNNLTYLGVCKIKKINFNKEITLCEKYIPPCIDFRVSKALKNFIDDLIVIFQKTKSKIQNQLKKVNINEDSNIFYLWILKLIDKGFRYLNLNRENLVHPRNIFDFLYQLKNELEIFIFKGKTNENLIFYRHEKLHTLFSPLFLELKNVCEKINFNSAISFSFEKSTLGIWESKKIDHISLNEFEFILAIQADWSDEQSISKFLTHCKIASIYDIQNLVKHSLPGIELYHLPTIPKKILSESKTFYFSINKNNALWTSFIDSKELAMHISGQMIIQSVKLLLIKDGLDA